MKPMSIPEVQKRYKSEWLLFEVLETDESNRPVKGKLLAHSPSRAAVHEMMRKHPCLYPHTYLTYTGPKPKKGIVSIL